MEKKNDMKGWFIAITISIIGMIIGGICYEYGDKNKSEPEVKLVRYQCICTQCSSKIYDFIVDENQPLVDFSKRIQEEE